MQVRRLWSDHARYDLRVARDSAHVAKQQRAAHWERILRAGYSKRPEIEL
jgi:hypothetical protein